MMLKLALLFSSASTATAFGWPRYYTYEYDWVPSTRLEYTTPRQESGRWMQTHDAYELNVALPEVEAGSLTAALSSDGKKIEIVGEKKIEGCSCRPTTVREVDLPYRPRPDDIDVTAKDGMVALRLARHSGSQDGPIPLTVKVEKKTEKEEQQAWHFVPHESATATTPLEQQEKSLTDKFRSAALATAATTRLEKAAATAATEAPREGANVGEDTAGSSAAQHTNASAAGQANEPVEQA